MSLWIASVLSLWFLCGLVLVIWPRTVADWVRPHRTRPLSHRIRKTGIVLLILTLFGVAVLTNLRLLR